MKRCRIALFLVFSLSLSAGCSGLPGSPLPTKIPEDILPTVIELTAQALIDQGLVPTSTIDPNPATLTPTSTQTPTSTPTPLISLTPTLDIVLATPEPLRLPNPLPAAEIQIVSPGRLSRVESPFRIHLFLNPPRNDRGEDLLYQISLSDENGGLINRETIRRSADDTSSPHVILELDFQVANQAEAARLEISSVDPYNRVTAMETTDVILLKNGEEEIKSILNLTPDIIIQQPIPSTLIQGGSLIVRGFSKLAPDDELLVECINRDGGQVGSAVIKVMDEDLGNGYRAFEGEIPFQVGYSSWIRVQVVARDGKFSGIVALSSVEVLVSP